MKMTTLKLLAAALAVAGFAVTTSADMTFNPTTAVELQTDLTIAANTSGANTILLENNPSATFGYYYGPFNYNSTINNSLTIQPDDGTGLITIDGNTQGRGLNINSSGSGNITVTGTTPHGNNTGITFLRNCGSDTIGALRIAAGSGNINVTFCKFLSPIPPATGAGMGLEIASGLNATIQNCYFIGKTNSTTGGAADYDGNGLFISGLSSSSQMLIQGCVMSGNYQGWGAYITASAILAVADNVFQTNQLGGLYFDPSSGTKTAPVIVTNNVFYGNKGSFGGANIVNFGTLNISNNLFSGNPGGGVYIETGVFVTNTDNTFIGNGGSGSIGGLELYNLTTAVSSGNTFSGNYDSSGGGGYFADITTNILTGNTFSGNTAPSGGGGGAYFASCPYLTLSNNTFSANQANNGSGGAVYITCSGIAFATVAGNTFMGNTCNGNYSGGALYITGVTNLVTQNIFERNASADGAGAIYDSGPVITMTDNLVVTNSQSAAAATGGGIFVDPSSTLYMINNTIFGNVSGGTGGGVSFLISGYTAVFNNIIYGNSAVGGGQDVSLAGPNLLQTYFENNDVANPGDIGNWDYTANLLQSDPQFFDPINGDYHFPGAGSPNPPGPSPCANAGTTTAGTYGYLNAAALASLPKTDLDGNLLNSPPDLGCYQFNNTALHPADEAGVNQITASPDFNDYKNAWLQGLPWTKAPTTTPPSPNPNPIPANYLTRAGYLLEISGGLSGSYVNDGSARPTNWKPPETLTPAFGPPGTPVNVYATGFAAGDTVTIYYDPDGVSATIGGGTADASGIYQNPSVVNNSPIIIPPPPGPPSLVHLAGIYTIAISGFPSKHVVTASFFQTPLVTLSPTFGPPLTTLVKVTASGFQPSEIVDVFYNGVPVSTSPTIIVADSYGNISDVTFYVPSDFSLNPNTYNVTVTGIKNMFTGTAPFVQTQQ